MKQLAKELNILPLQRKQVGAHLAHLDTNQSNETKQIASKPKERLNKEELRLLVKILKAIGHTCEHRHIHIQHGIISYTLNHMTLVFDGVDKTDEKHVLHLSPINQMLKDPAEKRPTWEKLKTLQSQ